MNFDATHIAIRERTFAELLDLALQLVRRHAGGLLVALVAGAAPWAVLNWLLIGHMAVDGIWGEREQYLSLLLVLMMLQAPLATAPITLYLGQVTFAGGVDRGRIARDFFRCLPQMLLLQGLARALTFVPAITFVMPYWLWPYLNELILLERNPLWAGKKRRAAGAISTTRRSKNLHRGATGELFVRWLASLAAGVLLLMAVVGGLHQLVSQAFGLAIGEASLYAYLLPLGGWLVVGYFAVVRFLAYLDLRIRREGWEVTLRMRAEEARLLHAV